MLLYKSGLTSKTPDPKTCRTCN